MHFECRYDPGLDLVEVKTHGQATLEGMLEMARAVIEACSDRKTANILVDHSDLDVTLLNIAKIERIGDLVASHKDALAGRKCAHVVAKDIQLGLVRAWEIIITLNGVTDLATRTFRNRQEAVGWTREASAGEN